MIDIEKDLSNVTNSYELILLYSYYAIANKSEPEKQLECFDKLIGNPYEDPKVFDALISLLDSFLDKNPKMTAPVISLLRKVLRTRHASMENCDFMIDMLKSKADIPGKFNTAELLLFIENVKTYKEVMRTLEKLLSDRSDTVKPSLDNLNGITTKYGVGCAIDNKLPNGVTTLYGVSRPENNVTTKYGVVCPRPEDIFPGVTTMYGVVAPQGRGNGGKR